MIIKYFELKKNLKHNINFYLLYGSNSGLIEETLNNVLKPNFSKNLYYYDEKEILSNESEFVENILNKSFFEQDKLIIINRISDKILNLIEDILNKKIEDLKIILISENLEKKSRLRNFFEKNDKTIITPFYEDSYQSLLFLTQNFLKEKKINISNENINFIIERSKGNRINLKNELEKIALYSLKKQSINFDQIIKLTNLSENYNISELPAKTIIGYKCEGLQLEDDRYILKVYHTTEANIKLSNFLSFGNQNQKMDLPDIDPKVSEQFSNGLILQMDIIDKKKAKNNVNIIAKSLKKEEVSIKKSDYKTMDFFSGRNMSKN